jgi:peptidylprolyl isomerase domain and WD repeat-containing protein 1
VLPLLHTDVALCYTLRCCALQKGDAASKLAISDLNSSAIHIYDVASGSEEPIASLSSLHASPVAVMRFNAAANTVISSDAKGKTFSKCVRHF